MTLFWKLWILLADHYQYHIPNGWVVKGFVRDHCWWWLGNRWTYINGNSQLISDKFEFVGEEFIRMNLSGINFFVDAFLLELSSCVIQIVLQDTSTSLWFQFFWLFHQKFRFDWSKPLTNYLHYFKHSICMYGKNWVVFCHPENKSTENYLLLCIVRYILFWKNSDVIFLYRQFWYGLN